MKKLVAILIMAAHAGSGQEIYDTIRRLRQIQPPPWKQLGLAYYAAGQHILFRQMMERALEADKADPVPAYSLGRHWAADVQDFSRAAEMFRSALRRDPRHGPSVAHLGHAEENLGNRDAALQSYREAVKIDGRNAVALLGLARLGVEPLANVRRALAAEPNNAAAHRLAAKLDPAAAIRHLEEAVRIEPADLATLYQLHRAYGAAGRTESAAKSLADYRRLQAIYGAN